MGEKVVVVVRDGRISVRRGGSFKGLAGVYRVGRTGGLDEAVEEERAKDIGY